MCQLWEKKSNLDGEAAMPDRHMLSAQILTVVLGLVLFAVVSTIAQAPASTAKPQATAARPAQAKPATAAPARVMPRTPWGAPDLQGTWFVIEDVPLERSPANANREFLTDEEVAAANKQKAAAQGRNTRAGDAAQDVSGAYNAAFNSVLKTGKRTSRVIDPPYGCIPPTVAAAAAGAVAGCATAAGRGAPGGRGQGGAAGAPPAGAPPAGAPAGAGRGGAAGAGRGGGGFGAQGNDKPEQIAQNPRCLGVSLPFLPLNTAFAQGTVMRIVQSPKSMAIYMEDDHAGGGNRVIYMDGRPHPPASVKLYLGDSRGRWEGDTLVVETTNFSQGFRGSNVDSYKMIERYTRVGPNDLRREITFDDPKTWTSPWTLLIDMGKVTDDRHMIFESACHEGNYGMTGILVGARMEERAAAAKTVK
jgi:hypothetical protein